MKERNPKIRRALLSVSDKSRLDVLARVLSEWNVELVSTGGTSATLKGMGYRVRDVEAAMGGVVPGDVPESVHGRVAPGRNPARVSIELVSPGSQAAPGPGVMKATAGPRPASRRSVAIRRPG